MSQRSINNQKNRGVWRWLIYTLIGMIFGVIDYYIQLTTVGLSSNFVYLIVAFGVWLIPVVPITIYEIRTSGSKLRTMIACVLTWVVVVFVYYIYILFRMMFIGQDSIMYIHISNSDNSHYWQNISSIFLGSVLGRIEWFVIAVVGGVIVGFLAATIYKKVSKKSASQ